MKIRYIMVIALLGLSVLLSSNIFGLTRMVIRFTEPDRELLQHCLKEGYDIASYRPGEYLDLVVNEEELGYFQSLGYEPVITQTEAQIKENLQTKSTRIEGYRTYNDMLTEIETLAIEYPDLVRIYDLGDSWAKIYTQEGNSYYQNYQHDIWGVKVTTEPDSLRDKPAVFYMGAHHAREPLSTEVTMAFLNLILASYETDPEINYLVANTELWFIPIVNPDGHKIVLNEVDIWWRKNLRDNNNSGTFNTNDYYGYGIDGVDLNRNYNFEWAGGGNFSAPTYPGPYGGSEPEVAPMQQLMADRHFVAGITYHTYSELVLYPYGYAENATAPDVAALADLAVAMATTIPRYNSTGHYTPQASWALYPARGVTDDYAYGKHGIFCYTFELATEFIPPPAAVQQIVADNMEAALILLRRVHHSTLTGVVTDFFTEDPLVAEIYIEGIDNTGNFRHPYKSNEAFGRYFRILLPGEYLVSFSAYGYVDSGPYPVVITEEGQTEFNIALTLAGTGTLSGIVTSYNDQEPVDNALVTILNTPLDPVLTDEGGNFIFDLVSFGTYQIQIRADGYGSITEEVTVSEPENYYAFALFTPYFFDPFSNLDNWIVSGEWGLSAQYSYSGDYSLADSPNGEYQSNVTSYARFNQVIDLTQATSASVAFMARYALEAGYDYCSFQVLPEGSGWQTIAAMNGIADWTLQEFSLDEYLGETISLRFLFTSDQYIEDEGIYIDDFTLYITAPDTDASDDLQPILSDRLYQNFPNPFNPETTISFTIAREGEITLDIYNILGQRVRRLLKEELLPGRHQIVWDGRNENRQEVGSGMYFYRLQSRDSSSVKKMILLK